MSPETLLLSLGLAVAFGGVPLATVIHLHIATTRAVRHVAEIETLAASRPEHTEDISRLGVRELQALAMATAEELTDRREHEDRGSLRSAGDRLPDRHRAPLAKAG